MPEEKKKRRSRSNSSANNDGKSSRKIELQGNVRENRIHTPPPSKLDEDIIGPSSSKPRRVDKKAKAMLGISSDDVSQNSAANTISGNEVKGNDGGESGPSSVQASSSSSKHRRRNKRKEKKEKKSSDKNRDKHHGTEQRRRTSESVVIVDTNSGRKHSDSDLSGKPVVTQTFSSDGISLKDTSKTNKGGLRATVDGSTLLVPALDMEEASHGSRGWFESSARRMWGFSPRTKFLGGKKDRERTKLSRTGKKLSGDTIVRDLEALENLNLAGGSAETGEVALKRRSHGESGESESLDVEEERDVHADLSSHLGEMIMRHKFDLMIELATRQVHAADSDLFFAATARFFANNRRLRDLLFRAFSVEILQHKATGQSKETLLRSESAATKLLSGSCMLGGGLKYMQSVLSPLIIRVRLLADKLEVSPTLLKPGSDLISNQRRLMSCTLRFIRTVIDCASEFPATLRDVYSFVREFVSVHFPGMEDAVIGNLLFLRWLCPAMVCPEKFGLGDGERNSTASRRGLILVSKLVVNVVNGVEYDNTKEAYMQPLNEFIVENKAMVADFLSRISSGAVSSPAMPKRSVAVSSHLDVIRSKLAECASELVEQYAETNSALILDFARFSVLGLGSLEIRIPPKQQLYKSKVNTRQRSNSGDFSGTSSLRTKSQSMGVLPSLDAITPED